MADGHRVERADITSEGPQALIRALNREVSALYGVPAAELDQYFALDAEEVAPGQGAFLVAYRGEEAVACGAVRLINAADAELKRMYVRPEFRRHGFGGIILDALEAAARGLGANRLVLQTGVKQPAAIAMYARAGFIEIPVFPPYEDAPGSLCMAKQLVV